jgi:ATP-binding cassette subfamily B (MDR/TAP) protein 1
VSRKPPFAAIAFWRLTPFVFVCRLNHDSHHHYITGLTASLLCGAVYPCFGLLYARAINGFSLTTDEAIKASSYRWGLWFLCVFFPSLISFPFAMLIVLLS